MQGRVKMFSEEKKFGFIFYQGQNQDLFFHISNVLGSTQQIKVGTLVDFELGTNARGKCAINISILTTE